MKKSIRLLFADVMAGAEDIAAIAVEGQYRDTPPEMRRVLVFQLRAGIVSLEGKLIAISAMRDRPAR